MPVVRPDSEIELLAGKELLDDEIELSGGGDSDSDSSFSSFFLFVAGSDAAPGCIVSIEKTARFACLGAGDSTAQDSASTAQDSDAGTLSESLSSSWDPISRRCRCLKLHIGFDVSILSIFIFIFIGGGGGAAVSIVIVVVGVGGKPARVHVAIFFPEDSP